MKNIILPAIAATFMLSCNTGAPKSGSTPAPAALKQETAANWKGEIPCADCEGIAYLLQLQPNDSFYERSVYLGKPGDAFVDKGTWEMASDSLVTLKNIAGETRFLAFRGDKLEMLDKDAKPINSPHASKYKLERTTIETNPAIANAQALSGVDFAGGGNEPFWSLEIDFDKSMRFKTPDGIDISVPVGKGERAMDAPVTRYHAETEAGTLTVQLFRQQCENDMSGAMSDFSVTVDLKQKTDSAVRTFKGCGQYLGAYRLNALWQLEKVGDKAVDAKQSPKGAPTMELSLAEEKVAGYGGCNRYGGPVKLENGKLTFGNLFATEMACANMEAEAKLLKSLTGQSVSYLLDGDMLYLGEGETKLTFKKLAVDPHAKGAKK